MTHPSGVSTVDQSEPEYSAAEAALRAGRYDLAAEAFRSLLESDGSCRAIEGLALSELELGNASGARELASRAVVLEPTSRSARVLLARALVQCGDDAAAVRAYHQLAAARQPRRSGPASAQRIPTHLALHNLEQWEYLLARGAAPSELGRVPYRERAALRDQLTRLVAEAAGGLPPWLEVSGNAGAVLAELPLVVPERPPASPQLNERIDWADIDASCSRGPSALEVVEDVLSPAAWSDLNEFFLCSTVWRDSSAAGFLRALPEDGLASLSVLALARELREKLPLTLGSMRLTRWWGAVSDATARATPPSRDAADFSLELWLTPETAVTDPDAAGLAFWPEAPRTVRAARDPNVEEDWSNSPSRVVPYRGNGAVLFDGRWLQATAAFEVRRGFAQRRRNLRLLFKRAV